MLIYTRIISTLGMWTKLDTYIELYNGYMQDILDRKHRTMDLLFLVLLGLLFLFLKRTICYYMYLPPGPWGVPFLGYLPFMKSSPHAMYSRMADKYGEISSIKLGNHLVVCLNSPKLVKELFSRSDSIARPRTPLNEIMEGRGIVLSEGILWQKQRQFLHEKFRALGVKVWPKQRFEKFIIMEIEEFITDLIKLNGAPVDPTLLLGRHVHNIICQLMMSFRFEEDDQEFGIFNEKISRGMKLYGSIHASEYVRQYLKLPGKKTILDEMKRSLADISEFHANKIRERIDYRATHPYDEPADLLDYYLDNIEARKSRKRFPDIFPGVDPEKQVVQVMNDLFSAGMETSRTTLSWTLLMMIHEPDVAAKVRAQLTETVHPGELVTLDHRPELPYLEAVLFETLRCVSLVPLGTTHVNTTEWKVDKYVIPKGAHIIPLIGKMNNDPKVYPEPDKFKPERFLRDGQFHIPDSYMAFGVGQRLCLGIQLARMQLFLFFANIMNRFEFSLPEGAEMPPLEGFMAATHTPLPYSLCFHKIDN
ncbi:cytochrome P450 18a1 [Bombyx mori]|uniref:Cytochrome P450 n=1 Tax=Bombyx mori TaxID=7091 RepID=A0A8R1WF28_BOMMO|nr:cytochrome P450 18a1 [Bombyx mori]XP_021209147.1 cytochrome P450 18a1 [Bombyx mori]